MKLYQYILGFVALLIAACAAYFSVSGLSKLFGGNALQIAIMASILEAGKLVCASLAYRLWGEAPKWIVGFLSAFTIIMMAITSLGIFGYLTSSYQEVSARLDRQDTKITSLETKRDRFEERTNRLENEREILLSERSSQQERLSQASDQYADRGWAQDQERVENIESQVENLQSEIEKINSRISTSQDSVFSIESEITSIRTSDSSVRSKLGPLLYTASAFGLERDDAIKWFIFSIMFVFDPMAVVLVITFNMVTGRHSKKETTEQKTRKKAHAGNVKSTNFYMPQTSKLIDRQEKGKNSERENKNKQILLSSDISYPDISSFINDLEGDLNNEDKEETIESITKEFYSTPVENEIRPNKKYVLKKNGAMIRN